MKRLLVTGAAGFLGWHICRLAPASWRTYGIVKTAHRVLPDGCSPVLLDLTDSGPIGALFSDLSPDAVIHTAAVTDPNDCENRPEQTEPINVAVPGFLASCCAEKQIPFVFTSSDLVFDGTRPPYRESDPPLPVNHYGRQKVRAEERVFSAWPEALICRLPLLYGWSGSTRKAFDHAMIQALQAGEPLSLFVDEFRTPVDAASAAAGILHFLGKTTGLLHMGGAERISRFDLGVRIAATIGVSADGLVPVRQRDIAMAADRPPDVSLDSDRARRLGYDPSPLEAGIREAVGRAGEGRTAPGDRPRR